MKLYKLTDQDGTTYKGSTLWGVNTTNKAKGKGKKLCTEDVIHAYEDPYLAILVNPAHADIHNPKLWEAKGKVVVEDGLKVGCKSLTTIKELPVPEITIEQKVKFAIYCSLEVYKEKSFVKWAEDWLSGKDRNKDAAAYAAAAYAAAAADAYAAAAAADAAAARAAAYAAAAAAARAAAARAAADIDFVKLARKAVGLEDPVKD